jgi:hypothetical protein
VDNYWFTDPNICGRGEGGGAMAGERDLTQRECRLAANYGWTVRRVRSLVSPSGARPVWNFVEVGHPGTDADTPTITGPEIRAAVWSSIISGARGIIYFNHSFGGSCRSHHYLRSECGDAVRPWVAGVNRQLERLAPVLNAPFVDNAVKHPDGVDVALKVDDGALYLLAGSKQHSKQTAKFTVKCTNSKRVTVMDEGRQLRMVKGSFEDSFADGNAVHIYRIEGRNTCGL